MVNAPECPRCTALADEAERALAEFRSIAEDKHADPAIALIAEESARRALDHCLQLLEQHTRTHTNPPA